MAAAPTTTAARPAAWLGTAPAAAAVEEGGLVVTATAPATTAARLATLPVIAPHEVGPDPDPVLPDQIGSLAPPPTGLMAPPPF